MEAPQSTDDNLHVGRILREIESDAEHFLAHHKSDSNGVDPPFPDAIYPGLPSVASPMPAADVPVNNGWLPSPAPAPVPAMLPTAQLFIIEQPVERCRFRYRAEHSPHGALRGADKRQKSCPKVKVEHFKGRGYVLANLYTNEEIPRPHVNELWGWVNISPDGRCRVDLDANMSATFPNLGIMRQKENDVGELLYLKYLAEYNEQGLTVTDDVKEGLRERAQRETATMKDCLHCVRLGFQAFLIDEATGREFSTPIVLSSAIFNSQNTGYSELKIAEIDKSCGHAVGGDRIWLRCAAKIRRDQIKVVFHEASTRWEAEGVFAASDVYEQILIIFKTPAFRDINITERVHVNLHLLRTSDNTYSPAVDFVYLPVDDGPAAKRPRRSVPAFGPSGFGYFPDQSPTMGGSPSESQQSYGPAEFDAYMPTGGSTALTRQHRRPPTIHRHESASTQSARNVDSGIGCSIPSLSFNPGPSTVDTMESMTSLTSVRSRIEGLSLAELNRIGAAGDAEKVQNYLTGLWETHVRALWNFSAEGDPEAFVSTCRGLIGLQDENGNTAMHIAVKNKQAFALKTMMKVLSTMQNNHEVIDQKNLKNQTALHLATRFGDADCVHYLITAGADRTAVDTDGQSVAHYLAETFNEDIYRDILFPPSETSAAKQKIDLAFMNNEGETAVHLAVKRKKLALLEALIEAGAPIADLERNTGKSALHLAVEGEDVDAVDMLLQNKVRVDTQAYDGTTALQLAAKLKHPAIVAQLIAAGADPNEKTSSLALTEEPQQNAEGEAAMEEAEEEVVKGEGVALHSAFDFTGDDQLIVDILNGKPYTPPAPSPRPPGSPGSQGSLCGGSAILPSVAIGGARPKTSPYVPSTASKHGLSVSWGRISPTGASAEGDAASDSGVWAARRRRIISSRSSSGSPEPLPAFIQDDLSTLDYVTRIRLSKHLDENGQWEEVAKALGCEHMIDFLKVCSEADTSSPTILLLDQLEQTPGSSITRLLNALRERGQRQAVDMIVRKQKQQQNHQQQTDAQGENNGGGGGTASSC